MESSESFAAKDAKHAKEKLDYMSMAARRGSICFRAVILFGFLGVLCVLGG
jgi:hypothetical protein